MTEKPSSLLDTRVIYCGDNLEQLKKLPDGGLRIFQRFAIRDQFIISTRAYRHCAADRAGNPRRNHCSEAGLKTAISREFPRFTATHRESTHISATTLEHNLLSSGVLQCNMTHYAQDGQLPYGCEESESAGRPCVRAGSRPQLPAQPGDRQLS